MDVEPECEAKPPTLQPPNRRPEFDAGRESSWLNPIQIAPPRAAAEDPREDPGLESRRAIGVTPRYVNVMRMERVRGMAWRGEPTFLGS